MKILVCLNGTFGGANYLLDRLYNWLISNGYCAEKTIVNEGIFPKTDYFDIAIMPSYIIDDLYALRKKAIYVDRVLVWIMGMGSFQDGYYNPKNTKGIKGVLTKQIAIEAQKALDVITKHKSICFTDVVGRYNTYKSRDYADETYDSETLIPIGILPNYFAETHKRENVLKCCWVGRVSYDFKYIPLSKTMKKLDEYCENKNVNACFTVVGDGDAIMDIKTLGESLRKIDIKYIPFLQYEKLNDFFYTQDIAFVMGTSALDAARNMCSTVVVTPVRMGIDEEAVYYRWIFESKGFSLGEYPGLDKLTNQIMNEFETVIESYFSNDDIAKKCWEYTLQFDEDKAFGKLLGLCDAKKIDHKLWSHIRKYYLWKKFINVYLSIKNNLVK